MAGEYNIHFSIIAHDQFGNAINSAINSSKRFKEQHKQTSHDVDNSNKKMMAGLSGIKKKILGLVGAYASFHTASKGLTEFSHIDKYSRKLQAITHGTDAQMKKLNQDIRANAKETGAVLEEQMQGSLELATAGISPDKMGSFLKAITNVKLLAKEDLGIPDIAKMMAVWKANFPNDEAEAMSDSIAFMLDKVPNISFRELQNSLGKSASLAKQMGFNAKELLAVESKDIVNLGGAVASTKAKRFLQQIMQGGEKIRKRFGIKQDTGLIDTIKLIDQGLSKMNPRKREKEIRRIFGRSETAFTFNQYVKNLNETSALYDKLNTSADGFAKKSAEVISPALKMKQISSTNSLIFTNIGNILSNWKIPDAILWGLDKIEKLTSKIANKGIKGTIEQTAMEDKKTQSMINKSVKLAKFFNKKSDILPKQTMNNDTLNNLLMPQGLSKSFGSSQNTLQNKTFSENKLKIEDQKIEIILNNTGSAPMRVEQTKTDQSSANIDINARNFFNR